MNKFKENDITSKFHLLNSQESTAEISWSSSEASDSEIVDKIDRFCNFTNTQHSRKRKRKLKVPRNLSNLDVTIVDATQEPSAASRLDKSPIIKSVPKKPALQISPVLQTSQKFFSAFKSQNLQQSTLEPIATMQEKSPILSQRHESPRSLTKIRKNLFTKNGFTSTNSNEDGRNTPAFVSTAANNLLNKCDIVKCSSRSTKNESVNEKIQVTYDERTLQNNSSLDDSLILLKTNSSTEMVNKVKAYFDDKFSSGSQSQHSITETQTPVENKSNDDIEIISSLTQITNGKASFESVKSEPLSRINTPVSFESDCIQSTKNFKYKKDGLAYRLNRLLRKHNAAVSLWQHERYLADNSKFVIPKGEFSAFRIRDVKFQYGCCILETMSVSDEVHYILIRNLVSGCHVACDSVLKLYEPFTVIQYENSKVIVNACKYECISI